MAVPPGALNDLTLWLAAFQQHYQLTDIELAALLADRLDAKLVFVLDLPQEPA
jgi:hypothetical protein